ncbi:GmrSD restriction endonuclease domain-containing protein [Mucilaginibacter celer]|uniref:DUF262 domain-containing protein n=1 Tax=Mucilaginibacter celer TaxID=2305508 RepID=A0A494VL56_9SPHI|nr:DUF262 domain-containing protein [Mucilaginibacter celer]AYL94251.1 DUF262 domain-containing protein [Mucilaginibacter celer]
MEIIEPAVNTATGEKVVFINLFKEKKYIIEVPIIQRDYAQGRTSKEKIRTTFLDALFIHLDKRLPIDLDFVYGTVSGTSEKSDKFIPLDGQQRLTTLFLLHWYLAHLDGCFGEFKSILLNDDFSRFTYETRTSSREFCNALLIHELKLAELLPHDDQKFNGLSKTIRNSAWYFLSWNDDPTIKGMLNMLDAIHLRFGEASGFYKRLSDTEEPLVTFQFLNLRHLEMTDDLYIKMNARGKALTDYENFKAQFIKFLEDIHPSMHQDFARNIDGRWCDLFWDFSVKDGKAKGMDDCIMNYFDFISEMLFYRTMSLEGVTYDFTDFKVIETIYADEANVSFLMRSLDLFSKGSSGKFKDNIGAFFEAVFSPGYKEARVAYFDSQVNLFEKLINTEQVLAHADKLLLYAIIYYFLREKEPALDSSDNLKDYLRICRNFIWKINQKGNNKTKDIFVSDLRTSFYQEIMQTCELVYDEDVYHGLLDKENGFKYRKDNILAEIFKARVISDKPVNKVFIHRLEDHHYLKGDMINFEELLSGDDLAYVAETFYQIFGKIPDDLVIRSMLAVGNYRVYIGPSYFGGLYFFGKGDKWHRVLTTKDDDRVKKVLNNYFNLIKMCRKETIEDKLEEITQTGLKAKRAAWIKLFLKYPGITRTSHNIFAIRDTDSFEIVRLGSTSLRGYHVNSIIHEVITSGKLVSEPKNNGWAADSEESYIQLKYSSYMLPRGDHWMIDGRSQDLSDLARQFSLKRIGDVNQFKLFPSDDRDMIETGIDFYNAVYQ